jgi:hypothetical protein
MNNNALRIKEESRYAIQSNGIIAHTFLFCSIYEKKKKSKIFEINYL